MCCENSMAIFLSWYSVNVIDRCSFWAFNIFYAWNIFPLLAFVHRQYNNFNVKKKKESQSILHQKGLDQKRCQRGENQ